ncbi:MAG TPA: hypothetical protein VME66_03445, partial [Candidatus Acidoferrales bacterium]|nr:hypothetical protein [Candidatus Acidoferrales bacterium]
MRFRRLTRPISPQLAAAILFSFLALRCALPAEAGLHVLPPAGSAVYLRVTETKQTVDGPQSTTTELSVRRQSEGTALIEEATDVWIARVFPDGTIQLNEGPLAAASDTALIATIATIDQAEDIAHGEPAAGASWNASLPLLTATTTDATPPPPVVVPMQTSGTTADYDITGEVQVAVPNTRPPEAGSDEASADSGGSPSGGGYSGGGGGYPGGGFGGGHHYGGGSGERRFDE